MISHDEHPVLFTGLIVFIVLSFVVLGLFVLRDKNANSGKNAALIRQIETNLTELAEVQGELDFQRIQFEKMVETGDSNAKRLANAATAMAGANTRAEGLIAERDGLATEIADLRKRLAELNASSARTPSPATTPARPAPATTLPDPELEAARTAVHTATQRVKTLQAQLNEANRNISRGVVNVPGSLKTWKEVQAGLERSTAAAQNALNQAKARLASISPTDPALRMYP